MVAEQTVSVGGFRTRVVTTAAPSRVPVLLLHGFGDTASTWRRVQSRLEDAGIGSIAVDQPGHGAADPIDPTRGVLDQMVDFAGAVVERCGEPAVVVGNSLGGTHALVLAARYPELVRGVVAIAPAALNHPRWFRALGGQEVARRMAARPQRPAVPVQFAGVLVAALAFGRPWLLPRGVARDWSSRLGDPVVRQSLREIAVRLPDEYLRVRLPLESVRAPVRVLWGRRDRLALISSRRELEARVDDLEFVALRGVGHLPQLERPGLTARHIESFIARISPDHD